MKALPESFTTWAYLIFCQHQAIIYLVPDLMLHATVKT